MSDLNVFNCAECGKKLSALDIKHGWVSVRIGWHTGDARVHTICQEKFKARPYDEKRRETE